MNLELIESFSEFKNIDNASMQQILKNVFLSMLKKKFNTDENIDVIVNIKKGDIQIFINKEVVPDGEVEDENREISYSDAIKIDPDFSIGEEVSEEFNFNDFGRRSILQLRQNLISSIMDIQKDNLYNTYKKRIGDIISGDVIRVWRNETIISDDSGNELSLPKSEQISTDFFKRGDIVTSIISRVDFVNNKPVVILSRTSTEFLKKLIEIEVPEISDGLIIIKDVVREPGVKSKVVLESYDDRLDPVGVCVGIKGIRVQRIVRELGNENIDFVNGTNNIELLIQRSLSPAKIDSIKIENLNKKVNVFLDSSQISMAVGFRGSNIRLTSELIGMEIDIYRNDEIDIDDVDLSEFSDEIEDWVIDRLNSIGCDTAKSVLEMTIDDLLNSSGLDLLTIESVLIILRSEFDN